MAPLDVETTSVDPPRIRRVRGRRAFSTSDAGDPASNGVEQMLGVRGNPGNRLAPASLAAVRLREAIAARNWRIDRADAPPTATHISRVEIDWVRSRDAGLAIVLDGLDAFRISGVGAGRPNVRPGLPQSRAPTPLTPALAVAIDGVIFTAGIQPGDSAAAAAARLGGRMHDRYQWEIIGGSTDMVHVRICAPILGKTARFAR